jgi:hypothetical protein
MTLVVKLWPRVIREIDDLVTAAGNMDSLVGPARTSLVRGRPANIDPHLSVTEDRQHTGFVIPPPVGA